ncbi:NADH-ubiquinone oxidoreductase B12 subunit family-domain-containing protein [Chaetomium strumarium]|uniref:NADH-ubiquinone oxidoreductase B12 subunit family-domain-containing protein n=1 Tax=Chaetomium strumarium TaxID=1170767 RepID=A0AAJ0LYH4_9PEZI|nr:NADH-ubiquinone oxidoreductase B12 subunit family-domain-containing protein [Chaetomium strumarium]
MQPSRILRYDNGEPKPNITGFDMRKFLAATRTPKYDPWERNEAWRYTGQFTRWNRFKNSVPGFGIAVVAFTGYCLYEHFFMKDDHHSTSGQHGISAH